MKNLSLITLGLVAAGLVSSASAQTATVYITGSTAYRANVNKALKAGGSPFSGASVNIGAAYADGASQLVFSNNIGSTPILIKTDFTGSEAGIASLAGVAVPDNVPGQPNANLPGTPTPTFLSDAGTATGAGSGTHAPDIAM